ACCTTRRREPSAFDARSIAPVVRLARPQEPASAFVRASGRRRTIELSLDCAALGSLAPLRDRSLGLDIARRRFRRRAAPDGDARDHDLALEIALSDHERIPDAQLARRLYPLPVD